VRHIGAKIHRVRTHPESGILRTIEAKPAQRAQRQIAICCRTQSKQPAERGVEPTHGQCLPVAFAEDRLKRSDPR
jgi:hypothetical protein